MPVAPVTGFTALQALGLAFLALCQVIGIALVNQYFAARKDARDAETRKAEKKAEWDRQDEVARRAAEAAEQVRKAAAETIKRTDEVARLAAQTNQQTQAKLDVINGQADRIHKLVNSDMTAARTNERDQTRLTLIALKRVQALSASLGLPIDETETTAIETAEKRIDELNLILADRFASFQQAEADEHEAKLAQIIAAEKLKGPV